MSARQVAVATAVVLIASLNIATGAIIDDVNYPYRCSQNFYGPAFGHDNETTTYNVLPDCAEGSLFWNYPAGYVNLLWNNVVIPNGSKRYEVCFTQTSSSMATFYDNTMGEKVLLRLPKDDDESVCVASAYGRVSVVVRAPKGMLYGLFINYRLKFA